MNLTLEEVVEKFSNLRANRPNLKKVFPEKVFWDDASPKQFPQYFSPELLLASEDLVALSDDLNPDMLKEAYALGIFPWYEKSPVLWYSPLQRMVFDLKKVKVASSFKKYHKKLTYEASMDSDFEKVIDCCQRVKRKSQSGTWITNKLKENLIKLHREGMAHSLEIKSGNTLIGGLYGLSLGRAFFGESMFSHEPNASKIAFYLLFFFLKGLNFDFIDGQAINPYLTTLGAKVVSKKYFLTILYEALEGPSLLSKWDQLFEEKKSQVLKDFQMIL